MPSTTAAVPSILPALSPSPRNRTAPLKANRGVVQDMELVMVGPMRWLPV